MISRLVFQGLSSYLMGLLAITCIGLLNANAIAEQSNNTQNIDAYCEQLTQAQRNTMEAVYDGDCTNGFYKLMYGVEELELRLKEGKEYDLTSLCEFNKPFRSLHLSGLNSELPDCISDIDGLIFFSVYGGKKIDLSVVSKIKNLITLHINLVENIEGVLDSQNLDIISIGSSHIHSDVKFIPQSSLDELRLSNVNLNNLDAFQGFSNLRSLTISSMEELTDMNALVGFHQLEYLRISHMDHPYDFPMLRNHPNLKQIIIYNKYFGHLDKLQYLPGLEYLRLNDSIPEVTDISVLKNLISLKELYVSGQDIRDISPLAKLPNLQQVDLTPGNQQMNDLTPYYDIAQHEAPISVYHQDLLSCSAWYFDEYQKGKRCNEQQRQKCGKKKPGLSRKFCVWWNRD